MHRGYDSYKNGRQNRKWADYKKDSNYFEIGTSIHSKIQTDEGCSVENLNTHSTLYLSNVLTIVTYAYAHMALLHFL